MSLDRQQQIMKLRRDFPNLQGNDRTFYLSVLLSNETHQLKITLSPSFPNGGVVIEFTEPVNSPSVAQDGRTINHQYLRSFNSSYWLSDIIKLVTSDLQQKGVQRRSMASSMYSPQGFPGSPSMYSPSTYQQHDVTKTNVVVTADVSWEKSYPHIGIDSFPESKLDQIKSSKEYREREVLNHTVGICHIQSWLQKYSKYIEKYMSLSKELKDVVTEHDQLVEQARQLKQGVDMKQQEIQKQCQMFTPEELKQLVKNRIQQLDGGMQELKTKLGNQEVEYASFMEEFTKLSVERNMLNSSLNYCS